MPTNQTDCKTSLVGSPAIASNEPKDRERENEKSEEDKILILLNFKSKYDNYWGIATAAAAIGTVFIRLCFCFFELITIHV